MAKSATTNGKLRLKKFIAPVLWLTPCAITSTIQDDKNYLAEYGLEVLIGIARFWAQRVNWSGEKGKYVVLGVTGPNEYENNVNNNWYTNYLGCLDTPVYTTGN
jgi:hypothetical protein